MLLRKRSVCNTTGTRRLPSAARKSSKPTLVSKRLKRQRKE
jgi:hypothetical protein